MSSIAGTKLRKDVRDAALHGRLRNAKQIGDLFVGIPGCNQLQNLNFPGTQLIISGVFSELSRDFRRYPLSPLHYRLNRLDKFPIVAFQQICPCASA